MLKIFFDLDGPILDVSERYYRVFLSISKTDTYLGKKEFWECKRKRVPWPEIFKRAKANISKEKFIKYWMRNIEMKRYLILDKIQPYTNSVLNSLKKRYILYLISLRQLKRNLFWEVRKFKIDRYFKVIIHCRHNFNKPWEEKAKLILKFLEPHEDALIVGDTEVDIRAARIAGIKSIAVTNGIRTKEILDNENADFVIPNLKEVFQILT